jgi:hypothetical protein
MRVWTAAILGMLALATSADAAQPRARASAAMPRYSHIFLIIDENKGYDQLMNMPAVTPVIHQLASQYGTAIQFYAEVHPSEANYIAMVAGDTFGIHDDDAFYCTRDEGPVLRRFGRARLCQSRHRGAQPDGPALG